MSLPRERRLRRSDDITRTVRGGRRTRSGAVVLHTRARTDEPPGPGVRVAFVCPRAVGNAVVRNRTRRRLQDAVNRLCAAGELCRDLDMVIRLLPGSGEVGFTELDQSLRRSLEKAGVLA